MAYKINRYNEHIVIPDGLATSKDVADVYRSIMQKGPEFYELEPAEVIRVYLDEEDLPKIDGTEDPDWRMYGWILARMCKSSKTGSETTVIKPLDTNVKQYPCPGEYVIVVEYFGDRYYTQKLNYWNSVNSNSWPGLSKPTKPFTPEPYDIKSFTLDTSIREIKSYEGDMTFNGRFGQSIRFGSNITELTEKQRDSFPAGGPLDTLGTPEYSPNIIIRAGQSEIGDASTGNESKPVLEDINKDASSIWITTDQIVYFDPAEKSKIIGVNPYYYEGKQIILNSDRLVFNSKLNDIFLHSSRDINLITKNRIVLEGHKNVYLGLAPKQGDRIGYWKSNKRYRSRYPNIQPVLKGDDTMKIIELLIDTINDFSKQLHGAVGGAWVRVPLTQINAASMQLTAALDRLKTRLDNPKSKLVGTI